MGCPGCGRGFHEECEIHSCEDCHPNYETNLNSFKSLATGGRGAPMKEDPNDPYSTGRKRAAVKYPLQKTNPCEWRNKKNCGGGIGIVGCMDGLQENRHHGPIKNTLHNEMGNVHRICPTCHNRWHAVNDGEYDELKYARMPHAPEEATQQELMANEMQWRMKNK